jgi:hypothetical protein
MTYQDTEQELITLDRKIKKFIAELTEIDGHSPPTVLWSMISMGVCGMRSVCQVRLRKALRLRATYCSPDDAEQFTLDAVYDGIRQAKHMDEDQ